MTFLSSKRKVRESMQPFMNPNYMNQYPFAMQSGINGMYVDNRQVVDATQCDLSGKPLFLPTTDGNAIYVKQLDNFGKSHITTYKKEQEPTPIEVADTDTKFDTIFEKLDELSDKIDKIKPIRTKKEVEE